MAGLAAASLILGGIGTVGQTLSSIQAARGQARAADLEAESATQAAAFEETQFRRRAALAIAKGQAVGAAAGLDLTSGSPLLLDLENARQAELEALNIRRTGHVAASAKRFEAKLARNAIPGLVLGGLAKGGSLLSDFTRRSS